jgi:hypothetical protein
MSYTTGVGFAKDMALAVILCQPEETRTKHLLWRTLATNNCSANVKSIRAEGTCPSHMPFAKENLGSFLAVNEL